MLPAGPFLDWIKSEVSTDHFEVQQILQLDNAKIRRLFSGEAKHVREDTVDRCTALRGTSIDALYPLE